MTHSHSDSLKNFIEFLNGWDLEIESIDDYEEKEKIDLLLKDASDTILGHLLEWEEKCLENDTKKGTNTYEELTNSEKYNKFQRVQKNLLWLSYRIKDIYEIKHRRTKQNLELRSQIAELKLKIKNI